MTTTKQLNENVFAYILNCIDAEGHPNAAVATKAGQLQFLADRFKDEYLNDYSLKMYGSYLDVFSQWIQGLPSVFNVDFNYCDIIRASKQIGALAPNATEKEEDKVIKNWFPFIANKTFQLMKKYKVLPYTK